MFLCKSDSVLGRRLPAYGAGFLGGQRGVGTKDYQLAALESNTLKFSVLRQHLSVQFSIHRLVTGGFFAKPQAGSGKNIMRKSPKKRFTLLLVLGAAPPWMNTNKDRAYALYDALRERGWTPRIREYTRGQYVPLVRSVIDCDLDVVFVEKLGILQLKAVRRLVAQYLRSGGYSILVSSGRPRKAVSYVA